MRQEVVPLARAFDTVDVRLVRPYLNRIGVPPAVTEIFLQQSSGARNKVRCAFGDTEEFEVQRGTRQGAIESPLFFLLLIDPLLHVLDNQTRNQPALVNAFADDLLLAHSDPSALIRLLETVRAFAKLTGTSVSAPKSWWLPVQVANPPQEGPGTGGLKLVPPGGHMT